ncbi:uncharacterized protein BP01DRAFT_49835 [Aspergillus saccharolyticus JOP 1030-1]|uniref:Uncharacterized protein n=1 Tax=Aspergillus saccharolyticus JOP 1030-1 TaxID=1450539 RepID=A0A318ZCZ4_9EURO|nr:hypothetical protein BP01DRAFT_49835 [Aspergillus saccharolyticus JOP 1030-1]PYH45356.1 hypothetical protein BP01DRAFT_49835 [Aspergillus saccharolyticus JOP 1030-1]
MGEGSSGASFTRFASRARLKFPVWLAIQGMNHRQGYIQGCYRSGLLGFIGIRSSLRAALGCLRRNRSQYLLKRKTGCVRPDFVLTILLFLFPEFAVSKFVPLLFFFLKTWMIEL